MDFKPGTFSGCLLQKVKKSIYLTNESIFLFSVKTLNNELPHDINTVIF